MSSTLKFDFRLRGNKAIERALIFEGLGSLYSSIGISRDLCYVGLGSVWFVDFVMAHRLLGVSRMVSIESDPIVYQRAVYNRPYRTIDVRQGLSYEVIPDLLEEKKYASKPWILWLDHDGAVGETEVQELRDRVVDLPDDSVLLVTFNAYPGSYGRKAVLRERLGELFGDSFPLERFDSNAKFHDQELFSLALSDALLALLNSTFLESGREGGCVQAFRFQYQDGSPMVTVGVLLAGVQRKQAALEVGGGLGWACYRSDALCLPPLTQKEVTALMRLMPASTRPTRRSVRRLGFDLEDADVAAFSEHYLNYPAYAVVAG